MKKRILLAQFIIFTIITMLIITGCTNNSKSNTAGVNTSSGKSNSTNDSESYTGEDLAKNIKTSAALTERGRMVVFAKNNNKVPVDLKIEIEFYDKNGTIVGSGSDDLTSVGTNSECAVDIYDTPNSFDNYKIFVEAEQSDKINFIDKIKISHNDNKEEIIVQVSNNSTETIDYITVGVVFYRGNKVVGYNDGLESETKPGRSANFNIYYPYDKKLDNVNFDSYKVFVNEAYSYNW